MEIGVFTKVFVRPAIKETFSEIQSRRLSQVQLNLSCAGLSSMPDEPNLAVAREIREEADLHGIDIRAVSGTFNMAHTDLDVRLQGLARLRYLAEMCPSMGVSTITLCTGSRNREDRWSGHPDNASREAWQDLTETLEAALQIAEDKGLTLAIEPETSNIVSSARKARTLLSEMRSSNLKVIIDAANLYDLRLSEQERRSVLPHAFNLIGDSIVLAHAKDILFIDNLARIVPAGKGQLDYDQYLRLLYEWGYVGPLILHGLQEEEVTSSISFLAKKLESLLLRY